MPSLVHEHRKALEAQGEYVTRANVGWFALFAKTLKRRENVGQTHGRTHINLIVYRTKSENPRDYHVIPMSFVRELLSEATLSDSATGEMRWNLVLSKDGSRLKVTHGEHELDVARFQGAPLITESSPGFDPTTPVEDPAELDTRVRELHSLSELPKPSGKLTPEAVGSSQLRFARRPDVKAWVLRQAQGRCELCGESAPFVSDAGIPYLEHHHVVQLAHGGSDTVENSVAVCPNCHRRLHLGSDRLDQRQRLYDCVKRLVPEQPKPNSD